MKNDQHNTLGAVAAAQDHYEKADLSGCIAKGDNSYILGKGGTGKTNFIIGVIINTLSQNLSTTNSKKFTNIVVVDSGRSYEHLTKLLADSQFITFNPVNESELAPIALSGTTLTVFELEKLKRFIGDPFIDQVIETLKHATNKDTLLIIDEWWSMNPKLKKWALTEFEGKTLVSTMIEDDITLDNAYHLFESGIELVKPNHKRSRVWRI